MKKWRCFYISRKPNLLPYEVIERATKGEPEAVDMVLKHYSGFIKYSALENGRVNAESEEYIKLHFPYAALRQLPLCVLAGSEHLASQAIHFRQV